MNNFKEFVQSDNYVAFILATILLAVFGVLYLLYKYKYISERKIEQIFVFILSFLIGSISLILIKQFYL